MSKHRTLLSTNAPENHLFMLDDFLGSGRISSIESKPMELLQEGETKVIDRVRISVKEITKLESTSLSDFKLHTEERRDSVLH